MAPTPPASRKNIILGIGIALMAELVNVVNPVFNHFWLGSLHSWQKQK
jgi:hypothetical protein